MTKPGTINLALLIEEEETLEFPFSITIDVDDVSIFEVTPGSKHYSAHKVIKYIAEKLSGN